ncbi:MAG: hypothetical protein ABEJ07_04395 [Candidatus Nanohaloarchaea archaeon]
MRQAFIRLSEIGGRTKEQEEELEEVKRRIWELKKSIAGEEDPHPFTSNPEEIEGELYG